MLTDAAQRLNEKLRSPEGQIDFTVEAGDMGIKIARSGDIQIFQYGIDGDELRKTAASSPTEEQRQLLQNGELLFALSVVANNPGLCATILQAARSSGLLAHEAANGN